MKYAYFGSFRAKEGKRDTVAKLWKEAAIQLKKNADCLEYIISTSDEDSNTVWLWQVWTSREAHDKSIQEEYAQNIIRKATPFIESYGKHLDLIIVGGKGIAAE